jgi:hypothetical protein
MAYSSLAIARRRCTATTRAGRPCRAWALWNDPRQLCLIHAGRAQRGPQRGRMWAALGVWQSRPHASYEPCRCPAYQWPHRPGGGRCRWPEEPDAMHPTPAGTHRAGRLRWRGCR